MKKKAKSKKPKVAKSPKSSAVEAATPGKTRAELLPVHTSPPASSPATKKAKTKKSGTSAKPAKPSRKRSGKKTTKRYSPESKAEILAFIRDHDATNRRGGKSAAVRKYGVSALTLSNWLKASKTNEKRVKTEGKGKAKTPMSAKRGRTSGSGTSNIEVTLKRMLEIRNRVAALMSEFESLKERI
jgi:transposase-like protein